MRFGILSVVLLVLGGCTCGSDATQGAQIPRNVLERPREVTKRKYDAQGELIDRIFDRIEAIFKPA